MNPMRRAMIAVDFMANLYAEVGRVS